MQAYNFSLGRIQVLLLDILLLCVALVQLSTIWGPLLLLQQSRIISGSLDAFAEAAICLAIIGVCS